jgi:hypothetical protein
VSLLALSTSQLERGTVARVFRYLLVLPDGEPADPPMFVTAVPTWSVGDVITVGRREQLWSRSTTSHTRNSSSMTFARSSPSSRCKTPELQRAARVAH